MNEYDKLLQDFGGQKILFAAGKKRAYDVNVGSFWSYWKWCFLEYFCPDPGGRDAYILRDDGFIDHFKLSSPWDLSTGTFVRTLSPKGELGELHNQNAWFLGRLEKIERGEMTLKHLRLQLQGICWICEKNPTINEIAGPGAIDTCAVCFDKD